MKEFTALSGPWIGQSMQAGFRLAENIELRIQGTSFTGFGDDVDGEFELVGEYDPSDGSVTMIRTYVVAPRSPSQVGYPFIYVGTWNGDYVQGRWMMSTNLTEGDKFEMWPESPEELSISSLMELEEPVSG